MQKLLQKNQPQSAITRVYLICKEFKVLLLIFCSYIYLVKDNSYDIILLDHMMPELDGVATVHILRESGITTPVIALTANSYTGSKDNYIKEGFTDYLAKPIRYKDLYRLLAKYLTTQEGK